VNYALDANLVILNRWGNVVCQWSGTLQKGANNLWDGKSKEGTFVGDGVYFYRIELSNLQGFEKERKLAGYVHVIGN
jgi:flagellar hook assembly protein FlgD